MQEQSAESVKEEDVDTTTVPEIDFKTKFAETKQYGRVGHFLFRTLTLGNAVDFQESY